LPTLHQRHASGSVKQEHLMRNQMQVHIVTSTQVGICGDTTAKLDVFRIRKKHLLRAGVLDESHFGKRTLHLPVSRDLNAFRADT
jgi:hypothetical protein